MTPPTPTPAPSTLPWRWLASAGSLAVLVFALWWLHRALAGTPLREVLHSLAHLPVQALAIALAGTALSYAALAAYDVLALRVLQRPIPWPRAALTAFMATAVGHNIGLSLLSGGTVRLRLYGAWGLGAGEVATLSGLVAVSFGLGVTLCAGAALLLEPAATLAALHVPPAVGRAAGAVLVALPLLYLVWLARGPRTLAVRHWQLPLPSLPQGALQLLLSLIDLAAASLVLWTLLPDGAVPWASFLGLYVLAMVLGIVSHVPAGLGVFEAVLIAGLPQVPPHALLAASLAYRAIYYLLCWVS